MKTLMAVLFWGLALAALAQTDVRVVGGKAVDLAPIHEWEAGSKTNARPLAHWKKIRLTERAGAVGFKSIHLVEVDGKLQKVILMNPPPGMFAALDRVTELSAQRRQLREDLAADTAQWRLDAAATPSRALSDSEGGRQIRASNETLADIKNRREQAAQVDAEFVRAFKTADAVCQNYAMFTGVLEHAVPVWDCGFPQK